MWQSDFLRVHTKEHHETRHSVTQVLKKVDKPGMVIVLSNKFM